MKSVRELVREPGVWLRGDGPEHEVVLSSRVRFARNLAGRKFPPRAKPAERVQVRHEILDKTQDVAVLRGGLRLELEPLDLLDLRLLGERQLVSKDLVDSPETCALVVSADETISFMINEEDHLRIQSMCSGFDLQRAFGAGDGLDSELDARLDFAYAEDFGFLTACPTNTGTGMRASVLMHLPGLVLDQKIEATLQELQKNQFTVRGFRGEGSTALGNFFQISNAVTLGLRESEIVRRLEAATRDLIASEQGAREHLLSGARSLLEDRIWRSFGILTQARLLGAQEALHHASLLRLGRGLKLLDVSPEVLNEILTLSQEAHSQLWAGVANEAERNAWRAERVRNKLQNSKN